MGASSLDNAREVRNARQAPIKIAPEGWPTILVSTSFWIVWSIGALAFDKPMIAMVFGMMAVITLCFTLFFFREPARTQDQVDDSVLLAPADGKVVQIRDVEGVEYLAGKGVQISIFLSVLDVHVNFIPGNGTIEWVHYQPGLSLLAWDERASTMNEQSQFGLKMAHGKVVFRQITGFLARRIAYSLKEGETVKASQRFGIMKFGSRMDVVVPEGTLIQVKEGDRVKAGVSQLAKMPII